MQKKSVYGILLVSLLILGVSLSFVVAQQDLFDPVKSLFTDWGKGQLSINIAKYVLWFVLILFIYSILAFVPFVKGDDNGRITIRWVLSILVGFLAMAYLTPSDVYTILASYSALGIVLGAVIPFIILIFFSIEMSREGGASGKILAKVVWIAFIVFLVWKIIDGYFFCELSSAKTSCISGGNLIVVGIVLLISILWIWFVEKKLLKALFKEELVEIQEKGKKDIAASLVAEIQRRDERSQNLAGAVKSGWDSKTDELRAELKRVQKL